MVEPTQVDEWAPLVIAEIVKAIGEENKTKLCQLLTETGSVIGGGFVLQSIVQNESVKFVDMDIYVPCEKTPLFLSTLIANKLHPKIERYSSQDSSLYCRSFLRRNGIRRIHTFYNRTRLGVMDVMSIRERTTPVKVCSNFDLTMCQVWFDGTTVFATHPEHIREKRGYLQGDYITTFAEGNRFLRNRMRKYRNRGFTLEYDPSFVTPSIPSIDDILKDKTCIPIQFDLEHWFKRIILIWLTETNKKSLHHLPTTKSNRNRRKYTVIKSFYMLKDEGYDSEEIDRESLQKLSVGNPLDGKNNGEEPELKLGRSLFEFVKQSLGQKTTEYSNYLGINLTVRMTKLKKYIEEYKKHIERAQVRNDQNQIIALKERLEHSTKKLNKLTTLAEYLKQQCTREGMDFAGDEGRVYDLHEHPIDQGTTADSMEGYLNQFRQLPDKSDGVPCYYKPGIGPEQAHLNCTKKISLDDIRVIVSTEFFNKFTEPIPVKTGLNTVMPLYELALPNVKVDAPGFGLEYSESMCPFCLQPITRGSGCSYMTHENPMRLDGSETPFCQEQFVVRSILDRYRRWATKIRPDYPLHIEFCVECGRPCNGHQHFDLTSTDDNPKMLDEVKRTGADGRVVHDYAACPGGGRKELFARMLAVRDIYANAGIMDPKMEREAAAVAADAAASDPGYLARGAAIVAQAEAERKFNADVPVTKPYDDPAYAVPADPADLSDSKSDDGNFDGLEGGGRKSRYPNKTIRKRNRGNRTTCSKHKHK